MISVASIVYVVHVLLWNIYLKLCILKNYKGFFSVWGHYPNCTCFKNYTPFPNPLSNYAEQRFRGGGAGPARECQALSHSRMSLCLVATSLRPSPRKLRYMWAQASVSILTHSLSLLPPAMAEGIMFSCSSYSLLGPLLHNGHQSRCWGVGTMSLPLSELPDWEFWQLPLIQSQAGMS